MSTNSTRIVTRQIPAKLEPLLSPARYKGLHGGRGGAKSHFFAMQVIVHAIRHPGSRIVCIREYQNSLRDSSKRLLEDKIELLDLTSADGFTIYKDRITTPGGGVITFVGMQDANAESIKSLEGYSVAWVEEAQTLSAHSLSLLRPTIRKENSELWFSWNPRRKSDPVDKLLRGAIPPSDAITIQVSWQDNPWFPAVLEQERLDCLAATPDEYPHIWEGEYAAVLSGAYYAKQLIKLRSVGQISNISPDPLLPYKAFIDIGGTGARSDSFAMWIAQFVGREIRVLNYYEAIGQPLAAHLAWLRENYYDAASTQIYLPHDGIKHDMVYDVTYQSALQSAGYRTEVIPNQGAGAAMARVNAGRRMFSACWFNQSTTAPGIEALSWYHEKHDSIRDIGLGPEHDWSSHGADAFGLMCIVAEQEFKYRSWAGGPIDYSGIDKRATL